MPQARRSSPKYALIFVTFALVAIITLASHHLQLGLGAAGAQPARPFGIVFILVVALMTALGGRWVGILTLALSAISIAAFLTFPSFLTGHFRPRDLVEMMLLVVVGGIVVATQDASHRAHEELRALLVEKNGLMERERLENLISVAVRRSLDAAEIRQAAVTSIGEALRADRCFLAVFDPATASTKISPEWHRSGLPGIAGEYAGALVGCVPGTESQATVEKVTTGKIQNVLKALDIRACVSFPINDQGRTESILTVAMVDGLRQWTPDECRLVRTAVELTRSALDIARVHERELYISETLQASLMPDVPRRIPGVDFASFYQACLDEASVGGDFAAVFALDEGRFGIVIGDLSGKGLSAAIQVSNLRNMVQYAMFTGRTVGEAVTRLNQLVMANNLLTGIATLFVADYDTNSRTLTYVSCGHEPGLLRRRSTGVVDRLTSTGPILAADETTVYEESVVILEPGDAFALYTDGLTESGHDRLSMLGSDGLANIVGAGPARAADLASRILTEVQEYCGGEFGDDVCLLVGVVDGN